MDLQIKRSLSLAESEISKVGWGGGLPGQELQLFSRSSEKKIREGEEHTSMAPDPTSLRFSILQTM